MAPRRWRVAALVTVVLVVGVLALVGLASRWNDADIASVQATEGDRVLQVVVKTCNADLSVDVEEYEDHVVVRTTHHD